MPPRDVDGRDDGRERQEELSCKGTKGDGSPCAVPPKLVDPETGYCPSHGPDAAEKLSEYGRKGGETTARRHHGQGGLTPDDLPPLVDHKAAEAWTDAIGRAVATEELSGAAGNAALRAVQTFLSAREAGQVSDRLDALMDALETWRETGDETPVLELVEGGSPS